MTRGATYTVDSILNVERIVMSSWSERRLVSPDTTRLLIERAHDELVAGNVNDPRIAGVRPLVRDSWWRSIAASAGVESLPRLDLDADDLEASRRAHPLADVIGMVRSLLLPGTAEDSGVVVAVGDARGRLLWVEGDRRVRSLTGDMGFVAGADWSESAVGTAAPGTALALDRSVQIREAEHFNRLVQPWSCSAAPVHDPETGQLLGVIDVTGGVAAVTPQARLLVDATARAVEGELLVARLRARAETPSRKRRRRSTTSSTLLRVLGRDRALLETDGAATELSLRHAEILLMLATHPAGLTADALAELVYGDPAAARLRPELVRLRRVLEKAAPSLVPDSQPYRLAVALETDAHQVLSLLDRGAHRVALAAYRGSVLPDSAAPGVEELRVLVRASLREAVLEQASVEVLCAYADSDEGADDEDVLRECLRMLPVRSPRRAGLVARIARLAASD